MCVWTDETSSMTDDLVIHRPRNLVPNDVPQGRILRSLGDTTWTAFVSTVPFHLSFYSRTFFSSPTANEHDMNFNTAIR